MIKGPKVCPMSQCLHGGRRTPRSAAGNRKLPSVIVDRVFVQIGILLGWMVIALPEVSNNENTRRT